MLLERFTCLRLRWVSGYCRKGKRKSPPKTFAFSAVLLDQCRKLEGGMGECDIPLTWGKDGVK